MSSDYDQIEKAIRYLEENFQDQPSLDEVAQHVNMSRYHFQRLFRSWVGISPKRFLQFLTLEYAKNLLEESCSVLDATYEAGLSSPSRMHDLFVTIDAVTPGEFRNQGAGLRIWYGIHPSPFGKCLLAATDRGICDLSFVTSAGQDVCVADLHRRWKDAAVKNNAQRTQPLFDLIFPPAPHGTKRSVTLFLRGTNFQVKVWEALLRIPPGFVCSYEDIARYIRKPSATRAVGNAVANNPVSYIIPCHRVIRKIGIAGNYRWSPTRKKAMLGWEAAQRYGQDEEGTMDQDIESGPDNEDRSWTSTYSSRERVSA
jgi:AraC family transcriptional regulator of adaptative response/methylated-DNA-[protein]-cysteine methyltransferase